MSAPNPLYYPVWIAVGRKGDAISWGQPCDSPGEASRQIKARIQNGEASLGVVVRFAGDEREALETYIWPPSARNAVRHYLDIVDRLDD